MKIVKSLQKEYQAPQNVPHIRFMVTSNCNLNCKECQAGGENFTQKNYQNPLPKTAITPTEIKKLSQIALKIGFFPIKITGGEATTRKDLPEIIRQVKALKGAMVNLGTNGLLLGDIAQDLKNADLDFVTIGLNTLNRKKFIKLTGHDGLERTLSSIKTVFKLGIPININFVLMKQNYQEIDDFIILAQKFNIKIRVLPLNNLGNFEYWNKEYFSPQEFENILKKRHHLDKDLKKPWAGLGSPMSRLIVGKVEVLIINPENGVYFTNLCRKNKCGNYPCVDGIWALRINPLGKSKYCFYPKQCKKSVNYLGLLRSGNEKEIFNKMKGDFAFLSSSTLEKGWRPELEAQKYPKAHPSPTARCG